MPYHFERFLTLRYLRGAEGHSEGKRFLRFVIRTAVGGVAVAVASLLLALSIVRGFSEQIEAKIFGIGTHVQVENLEDAPLAGVDGLIQRINTVEGVASAEPVVQEYVLLRRSNREIDGVQITGVEEVPAYIRSHLTDSLHVAGQWVVVGRSLARRLGIRPGDTVTLFSVRRHAESGSRPRVSQFVVSGIFETDLANYDDLLVYAGIDESRELLDYGEDEASRIDVRVSDIGEVGGVRDRISDELGFAVLVRSIYQVFRSLFAWVNLQESIIPFVIGVIVIVAAFNIVATLLMIILEKSSELGVLSSLGASPRLVKRLFVTMGLAIGLIGTAIGSVAALALELIQKRYEIIPLPAESYYLSVAPVQVNVADFLVVGIITVVLCALAAWLPARIGAAIDPVKVIRFR
ncbi:MAG: ABC transporter permease [Bacteroidetes bacterium]|nr:ABC transporter permease [Bacteroidota bacterium]